MQKITQSIRRYPIFLILLLSILVAAGLVLTKQAPSSVDSSETARIIDTQAVLLGSFSPAIPVFVRATTPYRARLRSSVTADVVKLISLEGDIVHKGDVLVKLDDQEPQLVVTQRHADVLEVKAQLASENNSHENQLFVLGNAKKLSANSKHNRQNIIKEHNIRLSRLNAQLIRAEAALKLAELDLKRTRIRAPFDGRITTLHVSVGDRVRPGDLIANIYDYRSIELRGPVATRHIATLQKALANGLQLTGAASIDGLEIKTTLDRLSGEINEKSGSIDAIFKIARESPQPQLGRNLRLNLQLPPVDGAFVVPLNAIYGTDTLYTIVNQRLKAVKIKRLGDASSASGSVSVLIYGPDLHDGDVILTTQLPNAIEGLLVKPVSPHE